jgi:hypothetical protein
VDFIRKQDGTPRASYLALITRDSARARVVHLWSELGGKAIMTENAFTVPVTATDLRVGDVIKWSDGRYYAVDTPPESGDRSEEYSEPKIAVFVTEVNDNKTPVGNSGKQEHAQEAILDVLTPRPTE